MTSFLQSLQPLVTENLAKLGLSPKSAGLLALSAYFLYRVRRWSAGGKVSQKDLQKDLSGQTVIVTGGCGGIGAETVMQLAKQVGMEAAYRDFEDRLSEFSERILPIRHRTEYLTDSAIRKYAFL